MYKRLIGAVSILFILLQAPVLIAQEARPFPMEEKALLWKVEGKEVSGNVYLFGTIHLIRKEYFFFPKKLEKLVKKTDVMVLELPGLPEPQEAMQYIFLKEGSFFDYFTPEQTDTILQWVDAKLHMNEAAFRTAFSKIKPFALVQTAIQVELAGKTESYELRFQSLAKENDIPLEGFETIAEQMSIFDDMTPEQQSQMVMESIRESEKTLKETHLQNPMDTRT